MNLVINDIAVRKNDSGLYSINDLHKASGGNDNTRPTYFFGNQTTKRFIDALSKRRNSVNIIEKIVGRHGGTFVSKELVYKYAAWVNPEFDLAVFETFISLTENKQPPATMKALNELTKKIEGDKAIASKCGQALAHYKKVKTENELEWIESISEAQLNLGFKL